MFCNNWLRATGLNFYDTPPPTLLPSAVQKGVGSDPCKAENILCNFRHVESMKGSVVTVEDKDPSVLWVCTDDSLLRHWLYQMLLVPSRWDVVSLNHDDVLAEYRGILSKILPRSLLPRNKAFRSEHIPYAYCTVKKKCFLNFHELTPEGFVFRGEG